MRLSDLLAAAGLSATLSSDPDIRGLSCDSRHVKAGDLFAALPGQMADGTAFIAEARAKGAVAVLTSTAAPAPDLPHLAVPNPRHALARLAAALYAPAPATCIAVTGTNGKTSTTHFAAQLWNATGHPAVAVGTLGILGGGVSEPGGLTSPDPITLHQGLTRAAAKGITHAAIEASSHGLSQYRLDGLSLKAAGFTYLGRDHLDYHQTEAAYFEAKALLFERLLPQNGIAVLNADTPEFGALAAVTRARGHRLFTYGRKGTDLTLRHAAATPEGLSLELEAFGTPAALSLPVSGLFQAHNILCALGLCVGSGLDLKAALAALPQLTNVHGRLERVATTADGAPVFVDYAHTADALEAVLTALRQQTAGRLHVVFGCGGNRDRTKRPEMGRVAARLADAVYVTDDNPRREDPAGIRKEIMAGCPGAREIADRAWAIHEAIEALQAGDTLLIAGKGHEQGQLVGDQVLPFDDAVVARKALKETA